MSQVRLSLAVFLGMVLQTLLVGLFIPLLIVASCAQWKKVSRGREINLVMAFTTVFFGLSITTHWILGVRRVATVFLSLPPGVSFDQYLLPPYNVDEIVRSAIFQFQIVVGDLIMIYRMYHIFDKSLLACVIPSITTAGLFSISCGLTNQIRNLNTPADFKLFVDWGTACFCVTLFNSAFMSITMSLRLWRVHRQTAMSDVNLKDSVILRAIRVLVESAALWTFFVAMNFLAFLIKSNLTFVFLDMTSPAIGISFCLIIVRLGFTTPEVRNDSWQSFQQSRALPASNSRHSQVPVPLDRVKIEQDVYVSESGSGVVEFHMIAPTSPRKAYSPVH